MIKKFSRIVVAAVFLMGIAFSIQAEEIEITFDEGGIALDDIITTQYQDLGIVWIDTYANAIVVGSDYKNAFDSDGQIINYTDNEGVIQLDAMADALSFEFRRPSNAADIYLELYDSTVGDTPALVHDFGRIGWDESDGWKEFIYDGEYGEFDRIEIYSTNKFVMDNIVINMTDRTGTPAPVPDVPADVPAPADDEDSSDISCFISSLW